MGTPSAPATLTTFGQPTWFDGNGSHLLRNFSAVIDVQSTIIPVLSTIPVVDAFQSMKGMTEINPGVAWFNSTWDGGNVSFAYSEALGRYMLSIQMRFCD